MTAVTQPGWLQQNIELQPLNTMGLPGKARYFSKVSTSEELQKVLSWARAQNRMRIMALGGGSNIVLQGDFEGLVISVSIPGRKLVPDQASGKILVQAGAGENWHEFVRWTIQQGWCGLENLSLIPGNVGAAPIQNIGAYGVEIKDVFHSLEAVEIATGAVKRFSAEECAFGYRDSVFKGECRERFIISSVTFELSETFEPSLGYGQLQQNVLAAAQGGDMTARLVSDTVCRIREQKLPDPAQVGNAGSFFKNPVIEADHYQNLLEQEPDLIAYPAGGDMWKLAAGWLIDRCGFRGVTRDSGAGVYQHQALVLVNHGSASGKDILALAAEVKEKVRERFGVELEIEPRIY